MVKNDTKKSFECYLENCKKRKHSSSCYNVSKCYFKGEGVDVDETRAEAFMKESCDIGNPMACHGLAHWWVLSAKKAMDISERDEIDTLAKANVPKVKEASKLLKRSCDDEFLPESCMFLAQVYHRHSEKVTNGLIPTDVPQALSYYEKACALRNPTACHTTAVMYRNGGPGVPKDEEKFKQYKEITMQLMKEFKRQISISSPR